MGVAVSPLLDEGLPSQCALTNVQFVTMKGLVVQSIADLGAYVANIPGEPMLDEGLETQCVLTNAYIGVTSDYSTFGLLPR